MDAQIHRDNFFTEPIAVNAPSPQGAEIFEHYPIEMALSIGWQDSGPVGSLPTGAFEGSIVFNRFLNIFWHGDALYSGYDAVRLQLVTLFARILLEVFASCFPVRFKIAFDVDPSARTGLAR